MNSAISYNILIVAKKQYLSGIFLLPLRAGYLFRWYIACNWLNSTNFFICFTVFGSNPQIFEFDIVESSNTQFQDPQILKALNFQNSHFFLRLNCRMLFRYFSFVYLLFLLIEQNVRIKFHWTLSILSKSLRAPTRAIHHQYHSEISV